MNHTHVLSFNGTEQEHIVKVLRTLAERYQEMVVGINGTDLLLRCKTEQHYQAFLTAWGDLV